MTVLQILPIHSFFHSLIGQFQVSSSLFKPSYLSPTSLPAATFLPFSHWNRKQSLALSASVFICLVFLPGIFCGWTHCSCLRLIMPPLGYQIPNPSAQPFLILPSTSSLFPSLLDHPYHHYINTLLFSPILIFLLRCNWHTTLCSFQMYNYFSHFKRQLLTPISPPAMYLFLCSPW